MILPLCLKIKLSSLHYFQLQFKVQTATYIQPLCIHVCIYFERRYFYQARYCLGSIYLVVESGYFSPSHWPISCTHALSTPLHTNTNFLTLASPLHSIRLPSILSTSDFDNYLHFDNYINDDCRSYWDADNGANNISLANLPYTPQFLPTETITLSPITSPTEP